MVNGDGEMSKAHGKALKGEEKEVKVDGDAL